jgi:HSP20 family protein
MTTLRFYDVITSKRLRGRRKPAMATLVRWEPFRELASLQGEINRLWNGGEGSSRAAQSWAPPLDVWETDSEFIYAFDLPGVPEDAISLEVQDDTLTVTAERAKPSGDDDRFIPSERRYGTLSRAVGLPQGADDEKIAATYSNGVLEVHVPKPEEPKPRRIQLALNNAPADIEGDAQRN